MNLYMRWAVSIGAAFLVSAVRHKIKRLSRKHYDPASFGFYY